MGEPGHKKGVAQVGIQLAPRSQQQRGRQRRLPACHMLFETAFAPVAECGEPATHRAALATANHPDSGRRLRLQPREHASRAFRERHVVLVGIRRFRGTARQRQHTQEIAAMQGRRQCGKAQAATPGSRSPALSLADRPDQHETILLIATELTRERTRRSGRNGLRF